MKEPGGFLGARYRLECERTGCTLTFLGGYEEVLDEGIWHARRFHGERLDDDELRDALRPGLREELTPFIDWPGEDKQPPRADAWP